MSDALMMLELLNSLPFLRQPRERLVSQEAVQVNGPRGKTLPC